MKTPRENTILVFALVAITVVWVVYRIIQFRYR
ncbi:MAG: FeoB-associated Cys-rich membrane protein [Bdellovibrionota bacterium]